jgi:hypothetical protein
LSDQTLNQNDLQAKTLTLETDVVLNSGLDYSLQFCEFNDTTKSDNIGFIYVNIEASFGMRRGERGESNEEEKKMRLIICVQNHGNS